jgi:hypothetical protein
LAASDGFFWLCFLFGGVTGRIGGGGGRGGVLLLLHFALFFGGAGVDSFSPGAPQPLYSTP